MSDVALTISNDVIRPIVEAKVQEAVISAMGGGDKLIEAAVSSVLNRRVNSNGVVDSYSSNNKFSWMEITVTNVIKDAVREQMKIVIAEKSDAIKASIKKQLSTKTGVDKFANAMMDGVVRAAASQYGVSISVELK